MEKHLNELNNIIKIIFLLYNRHQFVLIRAMKLLVNCQAQNMKYKLEFTELITT